MDLLAVYLLLLGSCNLFTAIGFPKNLLTAYGSHLTLFTAYC